MEIPEQHSAADKEGMDLTQYYENPYPHNFQVTLSVPEYVKKYGVVGTPQYVWDQEELLVGTIINKRASSAMLFCYDLEDEGATVQVKAHVSNSVLPQYEFTKLHSDLKVGDVVRILGIPGNRNRGGVTIYPRSFRVLSRRCHMQQ